MKQREIPQGENMTDEALAQWAQAFGFVATRYRVACSPGSLIAGAPWLKGKPMVPALTQLAREAELVARAAAVGVELNALSRYWLPEGPTPPDARAGLVLGFAAVPEARIKEALARLREAWA